MPFFLVDRSCAVQGAQPADVLLEPLNRARSESRPVIIEGSDGASCDGDSCGVQAAPVSWAGRVRCP